MLPSINDLTEYGVRNAKVVSINLGMPRRTDPDLKCEVRIADDPALSNAYNALDWLTARGYRDSVDWDIDMHSGAIGYTSFFFRDESLATEFKLVFG
jgi:hypothetical protein